MTVISIITVLITLNTSIILISGAQGYSDDDVDWVFIRKYSPNKDSKRNMLKVRG